MPDNSGSAKDVKKVSEHNPAEGDWFLQRLISIVTSTDIGFGITLNVGGFLISGSLVSGHKYFEGFGKDFATPFVNLAGDDIADILRQAVAQCGATYTKENAEDVDVLSYIHIENAKFFDATGRSIPSDRGTWWRGRIREVQGFMLGSLSEGTGTSGSGST